MSKSPTQETIDGNAKPPHRKWPAAVLVAGTTQLGITRAKLKPTKRTLKTTLAMRNRLGLSIHVVQRKGQRREPAAEDARFFSRAERLAPVRCIVLLVAGSDL